MKEYCTRARCEIWVDFIEDVIKPCSVHRGIHIKNADQFDAHIEKIQQGTPLPECRSCVADKDRFRLEGNVMWNDPSIGNNHVEFYLDLLKDLQPQYDFIERVVKRIALDESKDACIGMGMVENADSILQLDHLDRIVTPFYKYSKNLNRKLNVDFKSNFTFDPKRAEKIAVYLKNYTVKYPALTVLVWIKGNPLHNHDLVYRQVKPFVVHKLQVICNNPETYKLLSKKFGTDHIIMHGY